MFLSRSITSVESTAMPAATSPNLLMNLASHNIIKSLHKTMASSLDDVLLGPSMLDMMYTTLNRQLIDLGGYVGMSGDDMTGLGTSSLPQALRPGWSRTNTGRNIPDRPSGQMGPAKAKLPDIQSLGGESGVGAFSAPICDLFIEIFDLKENNWLRRQAIVVILQQFLGGTIERSVECV
jgi:sorting nexin-25